MKKIYIAGALFSESDRDFLEGIDTLSKQLNFSTYLPHKDGGLFIRDDNNSKIFFTADKDNIDTSDILIAVINGLDVDSGTSWEMGYAYSTQKVIIGYLEDIRIFNPERQLNPMILNCLTHLTTNLTALKNILNSL